MIKPVCAGRSREINHFPVVLCRQKEISTWNPTEFLNRFAGGLFSSLVREGRRGCRRTYSGLPSSFRGSREVALVKILSLSYSTRAPRGRQRGMVIPRARSVYHDYEGPRRSNVIGKIMISITTILSCYVGQKKDR